MTAPPPTPADSPPLPPPGAGVARSAGGGGAPPPATSLLSAAEWDAAVLALPAPHVLQSRMWGDLKERWGWDVDRVRIEPNRRDTAGGFALAQVLTRQVVRTPFRIGYIPKGPLLSDPADAELWRRVLPDLATWARSRHLTLLKMDADVPADAAAVADVWRAEGWRPSDEQIQFPNTMISDLTGGEDALLASVKSKTRYNIRLAERRGVTVRHGGRPDLDAFFRLYAATAVRAGFGIRARDYYIDAWSTFLERDCATVILAEIDGEPLAGVVPVAFGRTAWYLYGASADEGREHMPAHLAQWESLRWAIRRGCTRYDWWGGPSAPNDPSDPLAGVGRFKEGFGATLVEQMGAWDYPVDPARYRLYQWSHRARRLWLRRGIRH